MPAHGVYLHTGFAPKSEKQSSLEQPSEHMLARNVGLNLPSSTTNFVESDGSIVLAECYSKTSEWQHKGKEEPCWLGSPALSYCIFGQVS